MDEVVGARSGRDVDEMVTLPRASSGTTGRKQVRLGGRPFLSREVAIRSNLKMMEDSLKYRVTTKSFTQKVR